MSKIGVGVGEDFPVDENKRSEERDAESHCCGHGSHEAWRRFRHQMHAEWHARQRAMRDAMRRPETAEAIRDFRERHLHHVIIGGLAVVGLAALLGFLHHRDR